MSEFPYYSEAIAREAAGSGAALVIAIIGLIIGVVFIETRYLWPRFLPPMRRIALAVFILVVIILAVV